MDPNDELPFTKDAAYLINDVDHAFQQLITDSSDELGAHIIQVVEVARRHRSLRTQQAIAAAVQRPDATALRGRWEWLDCGRVPTPESTPVGVAGAHRETILLYDYLDTIPLMEFDPDLGREDTFVLDRFGEDAESPFNAHDYVDVIDSLSSSAHLDGIQIATEDAITAEPIPRPVRCDVPDHVVVDTDEDTGDVFEYRYRRFFVIHDQPTMAPAERAFRLVNNWAQVMLGHYGPCHDWETWTLRHEEVAQLPPHSKKIEALAVTTLFASRSGLDIAPMSDFRKLIEHYIEQDELLYPVRLGRCAWAADRLVQHLQFYVESRTTYQVEELIAPDLDESGDSQIGREGETNW